MRYLTKETIVPERVLETCSTPHGMDIKPYNEVTTIIGGVKIELSISGAMSGWNAPLNNMTSEEKQAFRKKHLNKKFPKAYVTMMKEKQQKRLKAAEKLRGELLTVCADYKGDISYINELDGLLVCEAEGMLHKIIDRIGKKATPKALKQYKRLMEIRKETPITCN